MKFSMMPFMLCMCTNIMLIACDTAETFASDQEPEINPEENYILKNEEAAFHTYIPIRETPYQRSYHNNRATESGNNYSDWLVHRADLFHARADEQPATQNSIAVGNESLNEGAQACIERQDQDLEGADCNRLFICQLCKKSFVSQGSLTRHTKTIHNANGEKGFVRHALFECDLCGKTFTQGGGLKLHIRTHTGEKPFTCDFCGRRFSQGCNLKRHVKRVCGEGRLGVRVSTKKHRCVICRQIFKTGKDLKAHSAKKHND